MSKVNLKRRVQKMIPEKSRLDRAVNEATNLQLAFQDEIKKEGVEITWGGRSLTQSNCVRAGDRQKRKVECANTRHDHRQNLQVPPITNKRACNQFEGNM
jgi:hypothetical protein